MNPCQQWHAGGHLALQSFRGINGGTETDINEEVRPKKRRAQRGVYRYKGNKDDPVKIIPPEESTWYKMYVTNFLMLEDDPMCQKFRERFGRHLHDIGC